MRRWVALAALAAPVVVPFGPAQSTTGATAPCDVVGFSPSFARDRTAFCARYSPDPNGLLLYRSTDAGRTWKLRAEHYPTELSDYRPVPTGVVVDPFYATTRTVYVLAGDGLYRAGQDGTALARVAKSPHVSPGLVTPYLEGVPAAPLSQRVAFATAPLAVVGAWRYDSGTQQTVQMTGGPTTNMRFLFPPDFPERRRAYVLAFDVTADVTPGDMSVGASDMAVFECDPLFVCATKLQSFGSTVSAAERGSLPGGVEWMVLSPHHTDGDPLGPQYGDYLMISRDGGRTWAPWTSATALLPPEARDGRLPYTWVGVTASPDAPHRMFLHLTLPAKYRKLAPTMPANQLFRSDDAGRTWRRIGYARAPEQPGRDRGNLPWNHEASFASSGGGQTFALPGGRLYVLAGSATRPGVVSYRGLYCSADLGRSWRRGGGC